MSSKLLVKIDPAFSEEQKDVIQSSFHEEFDVQILNTSRTLSFESETIPLIVEFSISAIVGGVLYDALKLTLKTIASNLFNSMHNRRVVIEMHNGMDIYIYDGNIVIKESKEGNLKYENIDIFIDDIMMNSDD